MVLSDSLYSFGENQLSEIMKMNAFRTRFRTIYYVSLAENLLALVRLTRLAACLLVACCQTMFFMDFEGFPNTVLHRLLYSFAIFSVIFGCDNYKDRARRGGRERRCGGSFTE